MRAIRGLDRLDLRTGARYLKLHHYADPRKDEAWLDDIRTKMSDTPGDFRREILMDDTVFDGLPVYENYLEETHCPGSAFWLSRTGKNRIPIVPSSLYFGGWDCGQTLNPAFVLLQVTTAPFQIHALQEVVSTGGESMQDFAPRVFDALLKILPGNWDEVRHFADATVNQRSGTNGRTARQEAAKHGFTLRPVSNVWQPRFSAVSWLLKDWIDERTPRFYIDGIGCPTLHTGFLGAYKWKLSKSGDETGPGAIIAAPLKNVYSHVHDALQMASVKIVKFVEGGGARLQEE